MGSNKDIDPQKPQFYGRRKGHPLRPHRQHLMDAVLPDMLISTEGQSGHPIAPKKIFSDFNKTWLEIGFGGGEHLAAQAESHPAVGFIGCEPYINGVATLLSVIDRKSLKNIRLFNDDARLLLAELAPASIDKVFILFSDPWPKKRHNRRRFINGENLDALSRVMADDAELRFATDDMDYISWALDTFYRHTDFCWQVKGPEDWRQRYSDATQTRYERKALKQGKKCVYLTFKRGARV